MMLNLITHWKNKLAQAGELQKFLAKAVAGTFGLKVVNAVLLYLNSLLLARILGAEGLGIYSYIGAWGYLLLIPSTLGIEGLILRELSVYKTQSKWSLVKGLLDWGNKIVLLNSIAIAALAGVCFWVFTPQDNSEVVWIMFIALLAVPADALASLRQPAMRAIGSIVSGQLPEAFIRPFLLILLLLTSAFFLGDNLDVSLIITLKVIVAFITCIIGEILLRSRLNSTIRDLTPVYQARTWFKSALPMLLVSSMYVINSKTDTIMLGIFSTNESVGIYTVANRGASLITFLLISFGTSLAPTFANLYAEGDLRQLQKIVVQSCRSAFILALLMTIVLITFGDRFLLMFGAEFVKGSMSLNILSLGQLINSFAGSVALLLLMTGFDKYTIIGVGLGAMFNIVLNVTLIPIYDAAGASCATTFSMLLTTAILAYFAYKKLNIISCPFYFSQNSK